VKARLLRPILELPVIWQLRRNHALEHATLRVLAADNPAYRLAGRSSSWGFSIYGEVPTEALATASRQALSRLHRGQRYLAIHPHCGTNLAVAGVLAGLAASVALAGKRKNFADWLARVPVACLAATLGILAARPVGALFQAALTTDADIGTLNITSIQCERRGTLRVHRVRTRQQSLPPRNPPRRTHNGR
jgi:hypothetical protein